MEGLYLEHLETVRNLIVAGWMLLALGWAVQLGFDAREDQAKGKGPKKLGPPPVYCPLHRIAREECEAKHHAD